MKNFIFKGAGVALITPMNDDGSVNFKKLRELVDWQIQNKTDAIIACGTTGESSTLNDKEHKQVIEEVIKQAKNKVPVIAGTGSNNTKHAVELSKEAQSLKADGDVRKKYIRIEFPNREHRDLTNDDIVQESFSFTESVCSSDVLKFGLKIKQEKRIFMDHKD